MFPTVHFCEGATSVCLSAVEFTHTAGVYFGPVVILTPWLLIAQLLFHVAKSTLALLAFSQASLVCTAYIEDEAFATVSFL